MIKRLSLIKDYYEDEEEEKEEKPGWLQRTRGIGELPKYEIPESTKLKFTADVGLGVSAKATGGISLPETTEIKPLIEGLPISKPEDKPTGWTTLFQDPKAIEFEKVNFEMKREWFKGLKEAKNKIAFLKGEDRSPELEELGKKYIELAPYMYGKGEQWLPNVAMIAYGLGVVWQLTDAVVASEIWKKLNVKVENKKISFEEGLDAVFKTGWGKGTPYQRQIFDEAVKQADIQNISVVGMLKKGLTITEMKPRFAFGAGKLSAMPIPDLVKAIVEYGSIPPEIAKEIAFLDPVKVSQVTQQLLNTSPALASAFLKAVEKPEVIPQVKEEVKHVELKPGEKTTREYLDRVMGLEKPEPAKVTPFIEPKVELKAEVKVPKEVKLPEKQIIPATIEEAKEILKVDVKKPSIPKDMLAKQMIEKKVSLTDIEAVKGIKIDVTKPKDIIIALRDIKAVKKEVTVEPTPKVEVKEPIIPKEVSQEKPAVEKFPGAEWKVTDDKSLAKLGNAIAKEVGITIEDITWRFKIDENIEKGYVRGSTTAPYRNDKGELVINIAISPKDKDIMPINLQSEILHELGHIAAPNHGILGMHDEDYWKWYSENSPKLYTQTTPPTEKPAVVEAPAPTKEDFNALDTTDRNKELFYEKYNDVYTETKKGYDKLIDETVSALKEEGFKGVTKGGVKRDEEGYVVSSYGATSLNPKWYRDFYAENHKAPTNKDLREIAIQQLSKGHTEDYGDVPANPIFAKLEAQLESYETILSDIKNGDYSFETPKNIDKLNNKLKELDKQNKKLIKEYEAELATLKADRASKYQELRKEAEAREKVEIQAGIKKGVEKVTKGKKLEGLSEEEIKKGNYLMGQINKIAYERGLTDKALTDLKRKYGYSPHLATATKRMSIEQLEAVLKAVNRARPKRIGYQKVITPKTERKIQSLKDSLIDKFQMSEEVYQETLKDLHIHKEPKYIDAKNFITEEQGKNLIYRLIDEANILRITEPLRIALEKNPEAKKLADVLDRRVKSEGERTLKDPSDLNSVRSYFQILETISGAPLFTLYQDLIDTHLENRADSNRLTKEFNEYRDIIKDKKELQKSEDWILAKSNLEGRPETPENITPEEVKLAKKIEGILKDYQVTARTEKFLDNLEHPEDLPQYLQYKKEIDKAKDIFESKGYDDLFEYMKTQEWGIIRNGYDPMQVVSPKLRIWKGKALSLAFGKEHIEVRKDIEYKEQDTNIITRLLAYKKQMDNLSTMSPKIKALVTLVNKNLDKFKDPDRVRSNLQLFFRELKGYDRSTGWFERGINRIYAQAMVTIIMGSPALAFRNLGQNFGLGHDKFMLIDPRNKPLTKDDMDFLDTHVQQAEFMQVDWFMTGEKPLPGLGLLTKIIKKLNLYPRSDVANRHWGFWGKINQVRMAFGDGDIDLKKKTEKAKFSDFSLLEQKRALQILAKDGEDAMARYVSKVYVDDVHFIYERAQRSLAEMGPYGKVFGNLMLFPRAYWEKLAKQSKKMTGKYVPFSERARAFKVIANIIIGGMLVSASYKKITGRQKSPYDPLELLAYEPGGLMLSTVGTVSEVYIDFMMAVKGDEKALADLTTSLPNLADMFIPFYNYTLRGLEASTDTKNLDRLALRKLRMLIDREYAIRGGAYLLERNSLEKWQYFLSGAGVDVAIAEREKKEKEAKPIKIGKEIPRLGIPTISKPGIKRLSIIKKF